MTYSTLLVHLELGASNTGLLRVTEALASRLQAKVIGIAARQPIRIIYNDGCYVSPEVIDQDRDEIEAEITKAHAEFEAALHAHTGRLEWLSSVAFEPIADYVAREAAAADLLLTTRPAHGKADTSRLDTGELLMLAGRPVLVVPSDCSIGPVTKAIVAWKDSREARRAALDALPLLKQASHVRLVELAEKNEVADAKLRLERVATWLRGHGIEADTHVSPLEGAGTPSLETLALEYGAGLIVAGAYGHSRVREWALGGMTRSLLFQAPCCTLLSH